MGNWRFGVTKREFLTFFLIWPISIIILNFGDSTQEAPLEIPFGEYKPTEYVELRYLNLTATVEENSLL